MIDSHAHLSSEMFWSHIDEALIRAKEIGIQHIINICTDALSLQKGIELSSKYSWIHNTAATTPHDVAKDGEAFFPIVENHIDQLIAIGETGLDYHYEHSPRKVQQDFLIRYIDLAKKANKPLIIHCRDAFNDLFSICDKHYQNLPLVLHCFTGTLEEARQVIERGWYLSLSGIVTFKKSDVLREVAKYVPLDKLLIETDTPYLAPQSRRGKMNEPAFIKETAEKIALERNISFEELIKATSDNAKQFFKIN